MSIGNYKKPRVLYIKFHYNLADTKLLYFLYRTIFLKEKKFLEKYNIQKSNYQFKLP